MSQPPKYIKNYSFSSFQSENPDTPLPANRLDQEFGVLAKSINQIIDNLKLIQRDDGALANGVVGKPQLDGILLSVGFSRPTTWATATSYAVDAAVFQSSKLYVCLVAHTSGVFATDLAAAKWVFVVDLTTLETNAAASASAAAVSAAAALGSQTASAISAGASAASAAASAASAASASATLTAISSGLYDWHGDSTGAAAYVVAANAFSPVALADGYDVEFRAGATNTAINPPLTVGTYAAKQLRRFDGSQIDIGDIVAGAIVTAKYSATSGFYHMTDDAGTGHYAARAGGNTFAGTQVLTGAVTTQTTTVISGPHVDGITALTDAATIVWSLANGNGPDYEVTIAGNRVLGAPTGGVVGQKGKLRIFQDATGSRTLDMTAVASAFSNSQIELIAFGANDITEYEYEVITGGVLKMRRLWMTGRNRFGFFREFSLGALAQNTTYAQAHGLGRYPALWKSYVECTTADVNYAIGDRLDTDLIGNVTWGVIAYANATEVGVVTRNTVSFQVPDKSTRADSILTNARWKIVIRIYD